MISLRALRLPFATASALPFAFGWFLAKGQGAGFGFALGLAAVICGHLSANLINDFADSISGADWLDRELYGYFGGSKLIQEGRLSERWYFRSAVVFGLVSLGCAAGLGALWGRWEPGVLSLFILAGAWFYSLPPLKFVYRGWGEPVIFLLFGLAPVAAGCFARGGDLVSARAMAHGVPFGFLTSVILFVNEVPDWATDAASGKRTWVVRLGPARARFLAAGLYSAAGLSVAALARWGALGSIAAFSLAAAFPAAAAVHALRRFNDKRFLTRASKLAIAAHAWASLVLILDVAL